MRKRLRSEDEGILFVCAFMVIVGIIVFGGFAYLAHILLAFLFN